MWNHRGRHLHMSCVWNMKTHHLKQLAGIPALWYWRYNSTCKIQPKTRHFSLFHELDGFDRNMEVRMFKMLFSRQGGSDEETLSSCILGSVGSGVFGLKVRTCRCLCFVSGRQSEGVQELLMSTCCRTFRLCLKRFNLRQCDTVYRLSQRRKSSLTASTGSKSDPTLTVCLHIIIYCSSSKYKAINTASMQ